MAGGVLAGVCVITAVLFQAVVAVQAEEEPDVDVLYLWRRHAAASGLGRVKRDWIIPPVLVSENSKHVPENLVQIKSDKVFTGEVLYRLEGPGVDQEPKELFEIDDRTGWIRSKKPLDREKHRTFKLRAFALSPSGEPLETPSNIEIIVLDQNDNRPRFSKDEFEGYVPEFSIPGTAVINVSATDADDPNTENAALSYSIIRQTSDPPYSINKTMFGINNETGVIYTRDVGLDLNVVRSFNLTLQVADMSGEGLASFATAVIYITDINNNAPRFIPDHYTISTMENLKGFEIGRVSASDNDEPGSPNWKAKYTISKGDRYGHFGVRTDPFTNEGILYVVKSLDYEFQKEYQLVLTVQNEVPPSLRVPREHVSSATVTITVVNENEAPRFLSDPIEVEVPESISPGQVLTTLTAVDPDNAKLRYDVEFDPEKWLAVNPETGELKVKKRFNPRSPFVKNNVYYAVVKVSDKDVGGMSTTATMEIKLQETNDFPPKLFPLGGTVCQEAVGSSSLVLSAEDLDLQPYAEPFVFAVLREAAHNWTVVRINDTHSVLKAVAQQGTGVYGVPVSVSDAGGLMTEDVVNVTVCRCDVSGFCRALAVGFFASRTSLSFIAMLIIIGSVLVLLLLLLLVVALGSCRRHHIKKVGLLEGISDDDIRDNVLNYDEQGGGEEDENAYNMEQLRNPNELIPPSSMVPSGSSFPKGRQPLRKDAPHNLPSPRYPRKPPADPTDIEDFINDGLDAADRDPNVPPYDTALIYDYEGDGSLAGSLSSISSSSSDSDQDYDYLNDWGPRFKKLANMYDPH